MNFSSIPPTSSHYKFNNNCFCFYESTIYNKNCRYCLLYQENCTQCLKIKNFALTNCELFCNNCHLYVCKMCVLFLQCANCNMDIVKCNKCNTSGYSCYSCKIEGCKNCLAYNDYKERYSCELCKL